VKSYILTVARVPNPGRDSSHDEGLAFIKSNKCFTSGMIDNFASNSLVVQLSLHLSSEVSAMPHDRRSMHVLSLTLKTSLSEQ
jgi:hypothetical protein